MLPFIIKQVSHLTLMTTLLVLMIVGSASAQPEQGQGRFDKGQRVWIDMPAININDDSYGEGSVIEELNPTQVSVYVHSLTTSKAFSSGVFCAPPSHQGWQTPAVYSLTPNEVRQFPKQQLLPWTEGYNRFFERQNWLHTFLKWADHHPVIERSQLEEHRNNALRRQLSDLAEVNQLMLLEFDAYQTPQFKPYAVRERINHLVPVLEWMKLHLIAHPEVDQAWRSRPRDQAQVNLSSLTHFMTEALDKVLVDAQKTRRLLLTQDISEKSEQFDQLMRWFQR